jgi:DNA polymerase-3 subunit delta'
VTELAEQPPWLANSWQQLRNYFDAKRIPQALLVTGHAGVGKGWLVHTFAKRLLCTSESEFGCGACVSCGLFEAQTHPDFVSVAPVESGKGIPVDTIRHLIGKLALKGQYSSHRVVLVESAHLMNVSAANSLLKSLEEPGELTTIMLVTDRPASLPATIVSRCQKLHVPIPAVEISRSFLLSKGITDSVDVLLNLSGGAPFKALELAGENVVLKRREFFEEWLRLNGGGAMPVATAEKWQGVPAEELLSWLISWLEDLIRLSLASSPLGVRNGDLVGELKPVASRLNLMALFRYLDLLKASRQMLTGQLNRQMLLEDWLIQWDRICSG